MDTPPGKSLLLTPGAGASSDHPSLMAVEHALASDGVPVERVDFPYRKAGRKTPDRLPVLVATVVEEATALAAKVGVGPERIVLGGRSMGGRVCSVAVAEGLPALGLVLISYPLHPPGRPDKSRTGHLPRLQVPCLFVSGTRDAFGSPDELHAATATVPGPVTHVWIDGGDHGLRRRDEQVAAAVREWIVAL